MVQNPKIVIFVTPSGQSPQLLVCSNLSIWGFFGTLDKCLCTLVSIFPKNLSEALTSPLKMAKIPKNGIFVTSSGQSPLLLVCSNLSIWGFFGTLDKCLCTLVSIFPKNLSEALTSPLKMAKIPKNGIFVTSSGQSPLLLVCSNLSIWGFFGTLDKCLCTLVSILTKFLVWGSY